MLVSRTQVHAHLAETVGHRLQLVADGQYEEPLFVTGAPVREIIIDVIIEKCRQKIQNMYSCSIYLYENMLVVSCAQVLPEYYTPPPPPAPPTSQV